MCAPTADADRRPGHPAPARGRLKFAVLQVGARMHYAVPALLKRAEMLAHFYTDAVGDRGLTGRVGRLIPPWMRPRRLNRLLGRTLPKELSPEDVTTVQGMALWDGLRREFAPAGSAGDAAPERLRRRVTEEDFGGANALYCLDTGDLGLIRAAKERGMAVVYEQIIVPQVGRILREERARFPGLERQDEEHFVEAGLGLDREVWKLADLVLAPSPFVRDGMLQLGAQPDSIRLVPYGLPEQWFEPLEARPIPGRILFVGSVGLRKGNHYLAEACRILADRGVPVDVRVIGPYDENEIASPPFRGPTYVGQVPRAQIREEFLQADVFAFPTLAEGFALAHLEAMACGLPVVTTPNCGPAVRDGQDGFVIPPRDSRALAERLQEIVLDRALRARLGASARERARQFSWAHYHASLLEALGEVAPHEEKRAA